MLSIDTENTNTRAKLSVAVNSATQHTTKWWTNASVRFAARGSAMAVITPSLRNVRH
jgi:hypothetical protein